MLGPPLPRQLQGFSEKHLTIALEVGDRAGEGKAYRGLLLQDHQEFAHYKYLKLLGNHNIPQPFQVFVMGEIFVILEQ